MPVLDSRRSLLTLLVSRPTRTTFSKLSSSASISRLPTPEDQHKSHHGYSAIEEGLSKSHWRSVGFVLPIAFRCDGGCEVGQGPHLFGRRKDVCRLPPPGRGSYWVQGEARGVCRPGREERCRPSTLHGQAFVGEHHGSK